MNGTIRIHCKNLGRKGKAGLEGWGRASVWETEKSLPGRVGKERGSTVDPTLVRPAGWTLGLFLFENLIELVGKIFMKIYDLSFIKIYIYTYINTVIL